MNIFLSVHVDLMLQCLLKGGKHGPAHYVCDELDRALCVLSFVVGGCKPPTLSLLAEGSLSQTHTHISVLMGGTQIVKRKAKKKGKRASHRH